MINNNIRFTAQRQKFYYLFDEIAETIWVMPNGKNCRLQGKWIQAQVIVFIVETLTITMFVAVIVILVVVIALAVALVVILIEVVVVAAETVAILVAVIAY